MSKLSARGGKSFVARDNGRVKELRGFGLKMGSISTGRFAARVRERAAVKPMLEPVRQTMLRARNTLRMEANAPRRQVLAIMRADAVCRRLMTVPGAGALLALIFTSPVDDPARFTSSKAVGRLSALAPKQYRSGETVVTSVIGKLGDVAARTALYEVAQVMLAGVGASPRSNGGRWMWPSVAA